MRTNLPVTTHEQNVPEGMLIVSKTDTKGKITFVNDAFLRISGYVEDEVVGQPHNILRHPDMPPEAFADMWTSLKAGEPWTGAVKNRCKNGDYYWVLATATPLREQGQIVGFMSVRRRLASDIREAAERGYQLFRSGKAEQLSIARGSIIETSWRARRRRAASSVRAKMQRFTMLNVAFFALSASGAAAGLVLGDVGSYGGIAAAALGLIASLIRCAQITSEVREDALYIKSKIQKIADGDYSEHIDTGREGVNGDTLRYLKGLQIKQAYDIEEKRVLEQKQHELLGKVTDEFEAGVKVIVQSVSAAAHELQSTAKSMTGAADMTSARSTSVAAASEQASSNVQTVAAATEQLSASINEIGRQVQESAQIANEAVVEAEQTNAEIKALQEAAQRIGDVVALINDVAAQTNLLALNATIEAARAGEAGKGFAVVASEVKNLANQTARATEDIADKITQMQSITGRSVKSIADIGATIGRINSITGTISTAVGEQLAATSEISRNVQQAALGTQEVASNVADLSSGAGLAGAAASQVLSAAVELAHHSDSLQSNVVQFVARVRVG